MYRCFISLHSVISFLCSFFFFLFVWNTLSCVQLLVVACIMHKLKALGMPIRSRRKMEDRTRPSCNSHHGTYVLLLLKFGLSHLVPEEHVWRMWHYYKTCTENNNKTRSNLDVKKIDSKNTKRLFECVCVTVRSFVASFVI